MFLKTGQSDRRNLLKLAPIAVAIVSTSFGRMALAQTRAPSVAGAVFNVRKWRSRRATLSRGLPSGSKTTIAQTLLASRRRRNPTSSSAM